jgi:ParB family chromosome partitioning protein
LISGRRRLEALRRLKRGIRTVCVVKPLEDEKFDQLHRRYRENAERENLSLYEELVAIGELFEAGVKVEPKLKAREFGKRTSVSEAKVSKARSIFTHRKRIEREISDPTALTLHVIDALLPALKAGEPLPDLEGKRPGIKASEIEPKVAPKSGQSFTRTQIIMGKKIVAKAKKGRVTIDLRQIPDVDETFLDKVLLFIAQQHK